MRGKKGTLSGKALDDLNRRIEHREKVEVALLRGLEHGDRHGNPVGKIYDRIYALLAVLDEYGLEIVNKRKTTNTEEGK